MDPVREADPRESSVTHLTIELIAKVQADVIEAVAKSTPDSTLPEPEQDRLLAQACIESCELLTIWLNDSWWDRDGQTDHSFIREFVPAQDEFARFLGPNLKAALTRARQHGVSVSDSTVDEARQKVAATIGRYPRMRRGELFEVAKRRVADLREEVCELASEAAGAVRTAAWRKKTRKTLGKVSGVLLAIVLAMAGAGPGAAEHNIAEWGDAAIHAVEVITVHHLAHQAQPGVRVTPPRAGPRIH